MNKKKGIIIVSCICIIIIALIGILAIEYLPAWLDEQEAKKAEEKERQIQEEYYIDEIRNININELTPIDSLNILSKLVKEAKTLEEN